MEISSCLPSSASDDVVCGHVLASWIAPSPDWKTKGRRSSKGLEPPSLRWHEWWVDPKGIYWDQGYNRRRKGSYRFWLDGYVPSTAVAEASPVCSDQHLSGYTGPIADYNPKTRNCRAGIHSNDWYQCHQLLSKYHVSFTLRKLRWKIKPL